VPDVTPRELRHFEVLTDAGGNGSTTLAELRESLRGSQRAHKAARARAAAAAAAAAGGGAAAARKAPASGTADVVGLEEVLGRLDNRILLERVEPRALFNQFDGDEDGRLDAGELRSMIRQGLAEYCSPRHRVP